MCPCCLDGAGSVQSDRVHKSHIGRFSQSNIGQTQIDARRSEEPEVPREMRKFSAGCGRNKNSEPPSSLRGSSSLFCTCCLQKVFMRSFVLQDGNSTQPGRSYGGSSLSRGENKTLHFSTSPPVGIFQTFSETSSHSTASVCDQ